jgi:transcriptional regulator with XRE-family HTH domain
MSSRLNASGLVRQPERLDSMPNAPKEDRPVERTSAVALVAASIRRERERAGLTLTELARRANIAKSTLSQLESGTGNPSVETLWAIGVALDVSFGRLLEPPSQPVRVVRAGEGPVTYADASPYAATLLASTRPHSRCDLHRIAAEPGGVRRSEPHMAGVVEHVVVVSGRASLGPRDAPVELGPGDYVSYPGDAPHVFEALAADTTAVMVSEYV